MDPNEMVVQFHFIDKYDCKWFPHTVRSYSREGIISAARDYYIGNITAANLLLNAWKNDCDPTAHLYASFDISIIEYDRSGVSLALCRLFDEMEAEMYQKLHK